MGPEPLPSLRPREAAARIASGALLLDVREDFELDLARVEGALHVPLADVPARFAEIPRDRDVLVLCHHGIRSAQAARWLRARGVRAINLSGGIEAWAVEVDPSVGRY